MKILLIDHQDSFTYNLVQALGRIVGSWPIVIDHRSIRPPLAELPGLLVLGPGPGNPGNPADVGGSLELAQWAAGRVPIFGLCLGLQVLAVAFGGSVTAATTVIHGKNPALKHTMAGIFAGIPNPAPMMRYNSLVVNPATLPACLDTTATSETDEIMAFEHCSLPIWGVQFHPESVGSPDGQRLLENVIQLSKEHSRLRQKRS